MWPRQLGLGTLNPRFVAWPLELGFGTRVLLNVRPTLPWGGGGWVGLAEFVVWPRQLGLGTLNPRFVAWPLELGFGTRVLLNVRPTLPWGGGGWVGLAEFQGGWVSPPPPGVGWDFVGALGLLSQCHFFLPSVAGSV